jgi:hypothetical protein
MTIPPGGSVAGIAETVVASQPVSAESPQDRPYVSIILPCYNEQWSCSL